MYLVISFTASASNPQYTENEIWTTWKARRKQGNETEVRHCIDYIFYTPLKENDDVGVYASAVLDGFPDIQVARTLFPNEYYPSDHIAIAADLAIVERRKRTTNTENPSEAPAQ